MRQRPFLLLLALVLTALALEPLAQRGRRAGSSSRSSGTVTRSVSPSRASTPVRSSGVSRSRSYGSTSRPTTSSSVRTTQPARPTSVRPSGGSTYTSRSLGGSSGSWTSPWRTLERPGYGARPTGSSAGSSLGGSSSSGIGSSRYAGSGGSLDPSRSPGSSAGVPSGLGAASSSWSSNHRVPRARFPRAGSGSSAPQRPSVTRSGTPERPRFEDRYRNTYTVPRGPGQAGARGGVSSAGGTESRGKLDHRSGLRGLLPGVDGSSKRPGASTDPTPGTRGVRSTRPSDARTTTRPESGGGVSASGYRGGSARGGGVSSGRVDVTRRVNPVALTGGVYATPYLGPPPVSPTRTVYFPPRYCSPFGFSRYGHHYAWAFRLTFNLGGPCSPYYWGPYLSCWYPLWYGVVRPWVVVVESEPTIVRETVYVQSTSPAAYWIGGSGAAVTEPEPGVGEPGSPLSIAARRYLTLGDRAFREERFTDAVQLYAKAIRFAPDEGGLYLVLADALFAAGDYHYGAYAIRQALELDPSLVAVPIDKRAFYTDPATFEHQLEVLAEFLADHPRDDDARLVLALNYLLGGRPEGTVELLLTPAAAGLSEDPAAERILVAAQAQR